MTWKYIHYIKSFKLFIKIIFEKPSHGFSPWIKEKRPLNRIVLGLPSVAGCTLCRRTWRRKKASNMPEKKRDKNQSKSKCHIHISCQRNNRYFHGHSMHNIQNKSILVLLPCLWTYNTLCKAWWRKILEILTQIVMKCEWRIANWHWHFTNTFWHESFLLESTKQFKGIILSKVNNDIIIFRGITSPGSPVPCSRGEVMNIA